MADFTIVFPHWGIEYTMEAKAGTEVLTQSGTAPDVNDGSLLLSVAAAFTGDDLTTVCGDHVVAGTLHKGYADVTTTGHMLIVDGKVKSLPSDIIHQSIKSATAHRGYLFQQCYIVENGVAHVDRIPQAIIDRRPRPQGPEGTQRRRRSRRL